MVIGSAGLLKTCSQCKLEKPLDFFFNEPRNSKNGRHAECKECTKTAKRRWAERNKAYTLKYAAMRYYGDPTIKIRSRERRRGVKYIHKPPDPVKNKARKLLAYAIRKHRIIKMPCEKCGNIASNAHHTDYSKPYDVTWLCDEHHGEQHRKYDIGRLRMV